MGDEPGQSRQSRHFEALRKTVQGLLIVFFHTPGSRPFDQAGGSLCNLGIPKGHVSLRPSWLAFLEEAFFVRSLFLTPGALGALQGCFFSLLILAVRARVTAAFVRSLLMQTLVLLEQVGDRAPSYE